MTQDKTPQRIVDFLNNKFIGSVLNIGKDSVGMIINHDLSRKGKLKVDILVNEKVKTKYCSNHYTYLNWLKRRIHELQNKAN